MGDERLRELERAWLEEGTEEAGEAYARARIQADPDLYYRLVRAIVHVDKDQGGSVSAGDVIAWLDKGWGFRPGGMIPPTTQAWASNQVFIPPVPGLPEVGTVRVDEGGTLVYMNNIGLWQPVTLDGMLQIPGMNPR